MSEINFFVIKPIRCTNFTNLFCHETLLVSDCSSVHHQEFIHCTLSNGVRHTGTSSIQALLESCLQIFMTYTIADCTVNKQTNCPKHVEFHDKINLLNWCIKKLVLLQRNLL